MDAGLRGFSVGGAQVSEKHCGFVVNTGGASASDVLALIREGTEESPGKIRSGTGDRSEISGRI